MTKKFKNSAETTAVISGIPVSEQSNVVTSELLEGNIIITKTQAKEILINGEIQTYTITMTNTYKHDGILGQFTDRVPDGMEYVEHSLLFNGVPVEPTSYIDSWILYNFGVWPGGSTQTISFQVTVLQ